MSILPTQFQRSQVLAALDRRVQQATGAVLRSRFVASACAPHDVDDYVRVIHPFWSVRQVVARVLEVRHEGSQAVALRLRPNANWAGHLPGQYVGFTVPIAGVHLRRCFTIASAPHEDDLLVAIRRRAGALVGEWAATQAQQGQLVTLSQALGDFVLPDPVPPRLLFVCGGIGVTPIRAFLRHLLDNGLGGRLACMYFTGQVGAFDEELAGLAAEHERFDYVSIPPGQAALDLPLLQKLVPDFLDCPAFVCGPERLERAAAELFPQERFHTERFVDAGRFDGQLAGDANRCTLTFAQSGKQTETTGAQNLLEAAERAGLHPAHGCRMGICRTCTCRKRSGVVRNLQTGECSAEGEEEIRLCVSAPCTDVTLEL